MSDAASRELILHIGASKTGTSALQLGLFASAEELAARGVGLPFASREESVRALLRPFGWVTASGFVRSPREDRIGALVPLLQGTAGERLLVTNEDLCELDRPRIELLGDALGRAGLEPRVVLSVRALSSVVPSEWQQFLKHRLTLDYPTFLRRLEQRKGRWAAHFWQRQDVAAILERWTTLVPASRIDVVVTPDRRTDPDGLYHLFGDVVGFDPARMSWPTKDVNASWGYTEAEVYRRLNDSLGKRLPRYEGDYQAGLRWPLVQGVLKRGASARIPFPPEHLGWLQDVAAQHVAAVRASGVTVHGELDSLVPTADAAQPLPPIDEAEVAAAAIDTLANFAVFTHQRRGERRPGGSADPAGAVGRAKQALRALAGR